MAFATRHSIPTFTPTMLACYERCPHQYHQKYVQKIKIPEGFSPNLACGNAAHTVLFEIFEQYRRQGGFPSNLHQRVEAELSRPHYPDDATYRAEIEKVLAWIKWVLMSFDGTVQVKSVERWLEYTFPGSADCPTFTLRHRVDLTLEHQDATIEHLDWKTGQSYEIDELQNVVARIVTGQAYTGRPRILSSTAFLANETIRTDELTRDQVRNVWLRIKDLVRSITAETEWAPVSNGLCPWCPYYQQGCPLYPTPANLDTTTDWLEVVA